jgi:hypothetical protein
MRQASRSAGLKRFIAAMAIAAALPLPAFGQTDATPDKDDSSRGVRILAAPTAPTTTPTPASPAPDTAIPGGPAPSATAPSAPLPTLTPSPSAKVEPATPALSPPPPASTSPASAAPGTEPVPSPPPPPSSGVADLPPRPAPAEPPPTAASLEALSESVKVANPAALAVEILPGSDIALDSKVSFRITTKKMGYLILVDVDPTGKLTQIYPNPMSLMATGGRENSNLIRAGESIQLPNPKDPTTGFEFVASPPLGTAMVVAFLSDRPVQMIDLPDLPSAFLGSASAADHLSELASELRITDPEGKDALAEAHWSMDVKFYAIR